MSLFDTHIIVDWSARAAPSPAKPAKDAIWIGIARGDGVETEYLRTRAAAEARLAEILSREADAGRRALIGFDFPFGYPAGVAAHVTGEPSALALWSWLEAAVEDGADNANNRFEVAARLNRLWPGRGPFWGAPAGRDLPDVPARASDRHGAHPPERRACEIAAPGAKTVWQLMYAGAVGSQVLLGLPALARLRRETGAAVWPFDTGWRDPGAGHVIAEIYPSLFAVPSDAKPGEIGDELQVSRTAAAYAAFDRAGDLAGMFAGPDHADKDAIEREEAWILGLGAPSLTARARSGATRPRAQRRLAYERSPRKVHEENVAVIRREARLDHLPDNLRDAAIRIVLACGMADVSNRLAWSPGVAAAAKTALNAGAPILCDCDMVAAGISNRLSEQIQVLDAITEANPAAEPWRDRLGGAIVMLGDAPTALFRILELIDEGFAPPAAILGFPAGFVGAAEAKAELAARPRGADFLTLRGRRGGPAMASAALNGLIGGLS